MNNIIVDKETTLKLKNELEEIQNIKLMDVIERIKSNEDLINIIPETILDVLELNEFEVQDCAYHMLNRHLTEQEMGEAEAIINDALNDSVSKFEKYEDEILENNLNNGHPFEVSLKNTSSKYSLSNKGDIFAFLKEFSTQIFEALNLEFNQTISNNWIEKLKPNARYVSPRMMCFALYCELTNQKELEEEAWNLM
ncbi:hypothetical protein CTH30272_03060 [Allocatenococcus thiocycli]|nr:hypothetical protein CTH30272_03060 [Catenococcus thiocycli]